MVPAQAKNILRSAGLFTETNEAFKVDKDVIFEQRSLSYADMWRLAYSRGWYHIRFEDLSIMQFQMVGKPSFHYIACPLDVPSLRDYLGKKGVDYRLRHDGEVQSEYEMVIETAELKKHVTPIRYDYDPDAYRKGVHPAAHLHVGLDNNVRLRLDMEMTPLSFLLFIIRHVYPLAWERLIASPGGEKLERYVRHNLIKVGPAYVEPEDLYEVALR